MEIDKGISCIFAKVLIPHCPNCGAELFDYHYYDDFGGEFSVCDVCGTVVEYK